jgi:tetratricopeptide (TPR) repeat protein
VRVGVAAALAHAERGDAARGDPDAVLAWAARLGDAPEAARVMRRAAGILGDRGERDGMLAMRERALVAWADAGAPGEAAYEAHEIMNARWQASELAPALDAARRGHALALRSDDAEMKLSLLGDLFTVLDEIGDLEGAAAALDAARAGPVDARMQLYLAFYDGLVAFRRGRFEVARARYRAALDLGGDPAVDGGTLRAASYNLVEVEIALGDPAAAKAALDRALALVPADPPPYARSAIAFFTAAVALAEAAPARAEPVLRAALADGPIADWTWQLEDLLGRALEARGDAAGAAAAYRRAIGAVEQLRRDVATDALQLALRDRKRAPYEAAFELAARAGRTADAVAIAEQMWTREFADAFAETETETDTDTDTDTDTETETDTDTDTDTDTETETETETDADTDTDTDTDTETDTDADTDTGTGPGDPAAARIRGVTAATSALRDAPAPPTGGNPAARDALAFVEARGAVWRIARRRGTTSIERLATPAAALAAEVAALRARPDDTAPAAALGASLIPESLVGGDAGRVLHVVLDGALGRAPVAALIVGGKRLIERRVLAIAPALSAIDAAPVAAGTATAVVIGAGTLPGVRAEAIEVAAALGVEPVIDAAATAAALTTAAGATVLHVAAHGGIDAAGAYVELADRRVEAAELIAVRPAPRVVVLASCSSGARPGRTLWGALGAAFLAAGSRAVIAATAPIDDAATRRLIAAFYAAGGATQPHAALAKVQRAAIARGEPASEWASLVALGAP